MSKKPRMVWVNDSILKWPALVSSASHHDDSKAWTRAHELWSHANQRLDAAVSHDDRADIISILRRVLTHRLSKLKSTYLESLKISKPVGSIEQLEYFGMAKPLMARTLLKIRNQIEYNDKRPPSKRQCAILLEFVWYFLRSTDKYLADIATHFEAHQTDAVGNEMPYYFTLEFGPTCKWQTRLHGWFEPSCVSFCPIQGWFRMQAGDCHQKKFCKIRKFHPDKQDEDWYISDAVFSLQADQMLTLCRYYFAQPKSW